jgi:oligopeptide/dipeptide ABC transporter ATP-binding protein
LGQTILKVEGISKHFDLVKGFLPQILGQKKLLKAVDNISFEVEKGKTMGLVGESGCGKSTTARLLTRLIEPTGGKVYFNETEILGLPLRKFHDFRKEIQVVFQDPFASLNPRKRLSEIIGRSLQIHLGMNGKRKTERVADLLDMVGLQPGHVHRYPHEFSGGQRQRIGIARALASNPSLIIADEPVSSLDVSVQAQILNLFKRLQKELNLTYIFISHDLGVVEHVSDTVAVMYSGKIVEYGPVREIFLNPIHPYTKALIASIPEPNPHQRPIPVSLRGELSSPINPPVECHLQRRCPLKTDICERVEPLLRDFGKGRHVACHNV